MAEDILNSLNEQQLEAVSAVDGPLLIVAGAGTGKTKVITSKIIHLLLNRNVSAANILALTFTEKATAEMITRVDELMPLSYEEVCIKTFHGFCDLILREKGYETGIDGSFRLIDQTQQWIFIKKNIFEFDLDYFRPLGNPGKFINILINHFSRLKDEDISPADYLTYAQSNFNALPEGADPAVREEAVKILEAARAYQTYQELKEKQNLLDFGDLQYYALRLLEKRASVLNYYQEKYKYILVDEFQDTNFAQNKMVALLAGKYRNLTVVGDDDQSIYKWRGASLSNILSFEKNYPDFRKVVLTNNYRSGQKILDFGYEAIQGNNPLRLEVQQQTSKKLTSNVDHEGRIEIWHFENYLQEVKAVVDDIEKKCTAGAEYAKFAILVRANQHSAPFAELLKNRGIPFITRDTQGLLRFDEIKDLLALLKFVLRPSDNISFFRLISLPLFDVEMVRLLELTEKARNSGHEPLFFYARANQTDQREAALPGLEGSDDRLGNALNIFEHLLEYSRTHSVNSVIGDFLEKTEYYKSLTKVSSAENEEKIIHIAQFIQIAQSFESDTRENSIADFLLYLESLEEAGGLLSANSTMQDKDAVSLLTVHSAKGLEFEHVYIPCLVAQRFPSTAKRDPFEIPEALIKEPLPEGDMHLHEERRLFYVACTRAKEQLILSYSNQYEGTKKWKISPFLKELADKGIVAEKFFAPDAAEDLVQTKKDDGLSDHNKRLLHTPEVKVDFLSYSQVDTFKTCPLKYKFRYLFNVPSPSAHAANFGSSLHNSIHEFYKHLIAGQSPDPELLRSIFEKCWINAGYESRAHEQTRKKQGLSVLENFYGAEEKNGFKLPQMMETPFRLKVGGISLTGRIDRIDRLEDGSYEVIDYKTGSSRRDTDIGKDMQLSLYAMACRDVFKLPVKKLSLYFLEDAEVKSTTRTDADIEAIIDELKNTAEELSKSDFGADPGFHCGWCEYRLLCNAV